jgi:hypothetical protein
MKKIFSVLNSIAGLAVLALSVTLVTAAEEKKDVSISCLIYDDLSFYDLRTLQSKG